MSGQGALITALSNQVASLTSDNIPDVSNPGNTVTQSFSIMRRAVSAGTSTSDKQFSCASSSGLVYDATTDSCINPVPWTSCAQAKRTGYYTMDIDGSGPLTPITVICVVEGTRRWMSISHNMMARLPTASALVTVTMNISAAHILSLTSSATMCKQSLQVECNSGVNLLQASWVCILCIYIYIYIYIYMCVCVCDLMMSFLFLFLFFLSFFLYLKHSSHAHTRTHTHAHIHRRTRAACATATGAAQQVPTAAASARTTSLVPHVTATAQTPLSSRRRATLAG